MGLKVSDRLIPALIMIGILIFFVFSIRIYYFITLPSGSKEICIYTRNELSELGNGYNDLVEYLDTLELRTPKFTIVKNRKTTELEYYPKPPSYKDSIVYDTTRTSVGEIITSKKISPPAFVIPDIKFPNYINFVLRQKEIEYIYRNYEDSVKYFYLYKTDLNENASSTIRLYYFKNGYPYGFFPYGEIKDTIQESTHALEWYHNIDNHWVIVSKIQKN